MSEESTTPDLEELARQARDAVSRRDFDAVVVIFAPDAVFDTAAAGGLGGVHEGREAIRDFLEDWIGSFEDFEEVVEEFGDLGNGVTFGVVLQRGRPKGTSGFVEWRFGAVAIWRDGLIERFANYADLDEARAAAERLARERG
jgi:ketosteroid isomerase-like protein